MPRTDGGVMRSNRILFLVLGAILVTLPLAAQNTNLEALAGIQFDFGNPGARSMGMGGAFLGLADDASAAEANPAGLTILRRPEVSLEVRHFLMTQELSVTGTFPNFETEQFKEWSRTAEIQFASIVLPRGNWAIAAYYHHPVNYTNAGAVLPQVNAFGQITQNVPQFYFNLGDPPGSSLPVSQQECELREDCFLGTVFPFVTAVDVDLKTIGLSGAWQMGNLSLGASARYQQFREAAFTFRFNPQTLEVASELVQATFDENFNVDYENDITFSAGFKYTVSPRLSIGGVYKQGAEFPAPIFTRVAGEADFTETSDVTFHAPDSMGIGISIRPVPVLTINLDAVNVKYSNLTDTVVPATANVTPEDFEAEDVTEYHAGAEYFFATRIPVAIRVGWWREPAHAIRFVGPQTCTHLPVPEEQRALCVANRVTSSIFFPETEDQDHRSVGIGLAWPNFQIDAAYDTSDRFKVGSISAVYKF